MSEVVLPMGASDQKNMSFWWIITNHVFHLKDLLLKNPLTK